MHDVRRLPVGEGNEEITIALDELCWSFSGASSNGCGTPPSRATTYTYDGNGNETGSSAGLSLVYNAKNQTTSITPPGGSATSLAYNGNGQASLTQIGTTSQTNDLLGVGYRTDSTGTTYYTHDPNGQLLSEKLPSGSTYYYIPDDLGSVIALTDNSGNVANSYTYDPYGQTTSSSGSTPNPWEYAQGLEMPGGDYHFGQRYYDPSGGLWMQQDSANQIEDPYGYAAGNPVNFVDPSGQRPVEYGDPCQGSWSMTGLGCQSDWANSVRGEGGLARECLRSATEGSVRGTTSCALEYAKGYLEERGYSPEAAFDSNGVTVGEIGTATARSLM